MENLTLYTSDNIKISVNYYKQGFEEVVIIAPGWCMTKDSKSFCEISEFFAKQFDVISFDFRGHGKSGGLFTFTTKEVYDIEAVVNFSHKNYRKIHLVGFSLGAAISLIFASKSKLINSVVAVSPPCDFSKIENQMWKKEAWGETFKKFELNRFLSIRPSIFIHKKIKPIDIIEQVNCPTLFIAGKLDPTVHSWHTEALYNKATCIKEFKLFENGFHAEDLFLHYKDEFKSLTLNWLNKVKDYCIN